MIAFALMSLAYREAQTVKLEKHETMKTLASNDGYVFQEQVAKGVATSMSVQFLKAIPTAFYKVLKPIAGLTLLMAILMMLDILKQSNTTTMKRFSIFMLCFMFGLGAMAQDRTATIDDLPNYNYQLKENSGLKIFDDQEIWLDVAKQVRLSMEMDTQASINRYNMRGYRFTVVEQSRIMSDIAAALKRLQWRKKDADDETNQYAIGIFSHEF